jgi:thioesterase domain-containing protein
VAGLAEKIEALRRAEVSPSHLSPLIPIQSSGSNPPFIAILPPGGTVFTYAPLARRLGNEQPVYGLQAPDFKKEDLSYSGIKNLAAYYVEAVRDFLPQGPYLLAGWCWGGLVAFEMAQQLNRQGRQVDLLALLDTAAPGLYNKLRDILFELDEVVWWVAHARESGGPIRTQSKRTFGLHPAADEER